MLTLADCSFAQRTRMLLFFRLDNRIETIGAEQHKVGPSGYRACFQARERNSLIRALPSN